MANGQAGALAGWPIPRVLDALQKLCHDAMALSAPGASGVITQYFPAASLPTRMALSALVPWAAELRRVARHAEHPWSEALLIEALVNAGAQALAPQTLGHPAGHPASQQRLDTLGA